MIKVDIQLASYMLIFNNEKGLCTNTYIHSITINLVALERLATDNIAIYM